MSAAVQEAATTLMALKAHKVRVPSVLQMLQVCDNVPAEKLAQPVVPGSAELLAAIAAIESLPTQELPTVENAHGDLAFPREQDVAKWIGAGYLPLSLDTETTGLGAGSEIISIAICPPPPEHESLRGIPKFSAFARPLRPINPRASQVHNMYGRIASNGSGDYALWTGGGVRVRDNERQTVLTATAAYIDAMAEYAAARGLSLVLFAHNGRSADFAWLRREWSTSTTGPPKCWIGGLGSAPLLLLDTLAAIRAMRPSIKRGLTNGNLYSEFAGRELVGGHDALVDAMSTLAWAASFIDPVVASQQRLFCSAPVFQAMWRN